MRKPINEMKLVIPSRSANESFARSAVAAFIAQLDPAVDELADIRTAVSEAVTNCIVHAYPDDIGDITLTVRLFADGKVTIRVKDKGCGIENVEQAMEPLFTTGGEERSGLGFSVMESYAIRPILPPGLRVRMRPTRWPGTKTPARWTMCVPARSAC